MSSAPSLDDPFTRLEMTRELVWYLLGHNAVMQVRRDEDPEEVRQVMPLSRHLPICAFPTPVPRQAFNDCVAIVCDYGELYRRVANNHNWLRATLRNVAESDAFTARLLSLLPSARADKPQLALLRNDFMLHRTPRAHGQGLPAGGTPPSSGSAGPLQDSETRLVEIEMNTISAGFWGVAPHIAEAQVYAARKCGVSAPRALENDCARRMAKAVAKAFYLHPRLSPRAVVLMVVQPGERNTGDQKTIEYLLWRSHGVPTLRATLRDVAAYGAIGADGLLSYRGTQCSVAYLRAGYAPDDYPTEDEWRARELMERSETIVCPNVAWQLAGAKKVQQELAMGATLERATHSIDTAERERCERVRASFVEQWPLDDTADGRKAAALAAARPDDYVMKPQREGGGNNLYGEQISAAMRDMTPGERAAHVLMLRVRPDPISAWMVRDGRVSRVEQAVSEFGFYSAVLAAADGKVLVNKYCGWLVRTKAIAANEGGVNSGYSSLDAPYLT